MPKISVLLPVYNTKEAYLRACIESILQQSYGDFELIIINDASTDEHVETVIKSYDDARIRYYKNDHNQGISETRNKLMDLARGEYLAIMDHDDISLADRFKMQALILMHILMLAYWVRHIGKYPRISWLFRRRTTRE